MSLVGHDAEVYRQAPVEFDARVVGGRLEPGQRQRLPGLAAHTDVVVDLGGWRHVDNHRVVAAVVHLHLHGKLGQNAISNGPVSGIRSLQITDDVLFV